MDTQTFTDVDEVAELIRELRILAIAVALNASEGRTAADNAEFCEAAWSLGERALYWGLRIERALVDGYSCGHDVDPWNIMEGDVLDALCAYRVAAIAQAMADYHAEEDPAGLLRLASGVIPAVRDEPFVQAFLEGQR